MTPHPVIIPTFTTLKLSLDQGILRLTFDRPTRKNALSAAMYLEVISALEWARLQDQVHVVIVSGGDADYFSSGNDLGNFLSVDTSDEEKFKRYLYEASQNTIRFLDAFAEFPKILIAEINGPAVGVAVTFLGHFDFIYAVEKATFHTPFMQLGQGPEGMSSFIFPNRMGLPRANEILLLGKKLTAQEAKSANLLNEVFPTVNQLREHVQSVATQISELPQTAVREGKKLIRSSHRGHLRELNRVEFENLTQRFVSDECKEAVIRFMTRKSKL